ncbi:MAG TPA: 50S ribosomal protein L30 [Saprospiraceae bacterium]|nr:50S ribosomal protein L30 [Saprospiraceae bacterium]
MAKLRITQIKSPIDRPKRQKDTLHALGLRKISQTVEHEDSRQILGMLDIVGHLVRVDKISS